MTSTNIFNGMTSEGRNSSRVLRPPGGGNSDILGVSSQPDLVQPKKGNPRNISSITEGTNLLPVSPVKPPPPSINNEQREKPKPTETINNIVNDTKSTASSAGRVRVPPGGFSSGLW